MKRILFIDFIMAVLSCFYSCGQSTTGFESVSPSVFAKEIVEDKDAYVLDVRTPEEFAEGHILGAHNLNWLDKSAFQKGAEALPKSDTIYVYCRSGGRSAQAAQYLTKLGYKVVNMDGGYIAWQSSQSK